MDVVINPHERVEDLQRNGYRLIQDPKLFCFGIDAVLLSDFARVGENESVIDLGTGNGVIPILLEAKTKGRSFIGLEIQPASVELAQRSVRLNNLQDRITIIEGDIKKVNGLFKQGSMDVVTSNPPYMAKGEGILNESDARAAARHEILCDMEDVIRAAARLLRFSGRFYIVHRPHRLADILVLLREYALEPKCLRFVHPYADKAPVLILIEGVRGGKPFMKVAPPLIIYNSEGNYTEEVQRIYGLL